MILSFVDPETYNRNQNSFKNCYWNELRLWPLKQKQHSNQTQMVSIFGLIGIKEKMIQIFISKKKSFLHSMRKKLKLKRICLMLLFVIFYELAFKFIRFIILCL